jgi:hypothetical protein
MVVTVRRIAERFWESDREIVTDPGARNRNVVLFRLSKHADFEDLAAVGSAIRTPLLLEIWRGGSVWVCVFRKRDTRAARCEFAAGPSASRDTRVISAMDGGASGSG